MSTVQIDRLLDTVIRQNASDLHLTVGRKPTLRLDGGLRNLDTKVLDSDDCVSLMKAITPGRPGMRKLLAPSQGVPSLIGASGPKVASRRARVSAVGTKRVCATLAVSP